MNHATETQEPVFAFMSDPATHGGQPVKRIDTHAASVFLAGARVFKIKRAVRFPFLDFSTLDKRKAACTAEIEVNRALAPDLYRGVVPITRAADGTLAIDGHGPPVEWAVEMRRFDETQTLDHLADAGRIDAALADQLGRVVATAHAGTPPVEPGPWIEAIGAYIEEHVTEFGQTPDLFAPSEVAALAQAGRTAYARVRPLMTERGRRGLIRRIHGDLHLGNIVLIEQRPVLFDAIEFSPLIASGDLLYDLAFLLMDLVDRGLAPAASIVLNRYLAQTRRMEDLDALAALPLYLSMRAAIRAKVAAERLPRLADADKPATARAARGYFELARRCIAPEPPVLVAIGGLSGTGKSALARALASRIAPLPGAIVLRSDAERKALFGQDETAPLPADAYTAEITARIYAAMIEKAHRALAAGHSAIVDAVFATPQERAAAATTAHALGIPLHGFFLEAALATRLARIGTRHHDASDADAAVAQTQETYDLGRLDWSRIDASGTLEATLAQIIARLR